MSSPLFPGQNRISTLEEWTLRVAAEKVEILPCGAEGEESRGDSLLGDAVAALEREGKSRFQMVDLGGNIAHFCFATRMAII